jgi:hypothetical protein
MMSARGADDLGFAAADHLRRTKGTHVGALVTLDLPEDAPERALPWIITFGPQEDDEAWEPVVCGPYELAHAMALAETVVADEDLLAVVEPVLPHASVDDILTVIEAHQAAADDLADDESLDEHGDEGDIVGSLESDEELTLPEVEPTPPPSPEEVRAGFARIASRLQAGLPAGV